jgi:hypothetical protein
MIRYALACEGGHGFEAWFGSARAYDEQAEAKAITCPACGSVRVGKAPMAPYVAKFAAAVESSRSDTRAKSFALACRLRAELTANADYVGRRFPEEARKIHFDEAPPRGIYGEATLEEARALHEDGIPVCPLPPAPEDKN